MWLNFFTFIITKYWQEFCNWKEFVKQKHNNWTQLERHIKFLKLNQGKRWIGMTLLGDYSKLDTITKQVNLVKRGVLQHDRLNMSSKLGWKKMYHTYSLTLFKCWKYGMVFWSGWVYVSTAFHDKGWESFTQFPGLLGGGIELIDKAKVVEFACMWRLWNTRDHYIF